jgi:ribose transport system permease protein
VSWYTKGNNILSGISSTATNFGSRLWLGIPRILYVVAVVVVVAWYLLRYTPFGRSLYAIGSNNRAAALAGIDVAKATTVCFVISATLSAAAGVLTVAVNGGAIISEGTGFLFPALTAVFLGATVITIGRYNVIGTGIGVLFVAASVSGLTLAGAESWVSDVFNGAALIVAIAIATILSRRRSASSLAAASQGGL